MPLTTSNGKLRAHAIAGILFTLIWLGFITLSKNIFVHVEDSLQTVLTTLMPTQTVPPSVAVVDIDDESLLTVGQWPWPRYILGNLIRAMKSDASQVIGLDVLFLEKDRTSLDYIQQRFKTEFGIDMSYVGVPPTMRDNDAYLARVIRDNAPVVGAVQLLLGQDHSGNAAGYPQAQSILKNIPPVDDALTRYGFINFVKEQDGLLRSVPMLIDSPEGRVPSFALAMLMARAHVSQVETEETFWGQRIKVGPYTIPVDKTGHAWLNYDVQAKNYVTLRASSILAGQQTATPQPFILIGSTAAALHDNVMTPINKNFPGLGVHATLLNNIVNQQLIIHPAWITTWHVLTSLAMAALINALYFASPGFPGRLWGVLAVVTVAFITMCAIFYYSHVWLPVLYGMTGALVLAFIHESIEYLVLRKNLSIWKADLENTNHALLHAMASICDTRDPDTGGHITRTQHYVKCLAEWLYEQGHPEAQHPFFVDSLFHAAPLHDVGKVAIPDAILLKAGRLTEEEFEVIKTHTTVGKNLLSETADKLREPGIFLRCAIDIAGSHHERWDGKGYPDGLTGTDIPFSARVMAVADVYDALISNRVYKAGMPHHKAVSIIVEGSGTQFDPSVVTAFLKNEDQLQRISATFGVD